MQDYSQDGGERWSQLRFMPINGVILNCTRSEGEGWWMQKGWNILHVEGRSERTYQVTEAQNTQEQENTGGQYCTTLKR